MRKIYLVRHGQPVFPDDKRLCMGQTTNLPINDKYKELAKGLSDIFKDKDIDNYYTSPLYRAQQTLFSFLPKGKNANLLPGIIEVNYGKWEGIEISKLPNGYGQGYIRASNGIVDPAYPDPEVVEDIELASKRACDALLTTKGNSVVVAHTTIISMVLSRVTGLKREDYTQFPIPYLSVTELEEEGGELKLIAAHVDHLGLGVR